MEATRDPTVQIEANGDDWIRYTRTDGRRWEVHGQCDHRGLCMIGANVRGIQIRDLEHLAEVVRLYPEEFDRDIIGDTPITPEAGQSCCPFTYVELEPWC